MFPPTSVTSIASIPWPGPRVLLRLHRRGLGFARMDWPELARAVDRHRPRVLSLDVFDTCLIRDPATDRPIAAAYVHRNGLDERPDVADLVGHWWNHLTPSEARALARLAFEHDEAGAAIRPFATPYSLVRAARSVKVKVAPKPRSGVFSRVGS